jgi:hypothetical protein
MKLFLGAAAESISLVYRKGRWMDGWRGDPLLFLT